MSKAKDFSPSTSAEKPFFVDYYSDVSKVQWKILREMYKINERMTREELYDKTRIPKTTLFDNLKKLWYWGFVESFQEKIGRERGAPNTFWELSDGKEIDFSCKKRLEKYGGIIISKINPSLLPTIKTKI